MRCPAFLALAIFLGACPLADAQGKRRVFVLHSGMHIILAPHDKNQAARTLKRVLAQRGIPERDLIAMDSPFPMATVNEMVPREGLLIYLGSADPASRVSQDAYLRMHQALKAAGVTPKDDVVWIGHSAGGQIGMTMAYLAHHLAKFPELAKKTQAYHFEAVVTLGAAIGSNPTPKNVKLRHYYSADDTMIFFLCKHGHLVADSIKSKVKFRICCDVGANAKLRVFPGIEHAYWYFDDDVLACILREFEPRSRPAWRKTQADAPAGVALSQLIARGMEEHLRISLEDDRH